MNQAFSKYAIWIILLVGAVLRLYNLHELPYTHDELSALNRLDFSSLSALLWEGIAVDGHPAGVQVFLWFWTSMFGEAEWVVKLPFVISGIASIFVLFKVGEMWFSKNAGLMAAAALATLQYPITYSQVARPYATGLLLVLLLVWAWSSVYIRKDKSVINYILMAVLFAGCAYNHYFSFLTAIIIGCSSILFWKSIDWRFIGVSIVGAAVLFLPHTSVTLNQLSLRGVKWIGPPDSYFFQEFFSYLFHYSNYVGLLFIIVFLLGIVRRLDFNREDILKRVILLIWFLLPCVIGYFYSLHVSPVLQFSVLIFSFPFFLLLMFSWCGNIASPLFTILLFLTLTVNGISLIIERDHYTIFYDQPYKAFDKFYFENRDIPMIYKGNPDYFNRYLAEDWSHVYDYGSLGDVRGMMNFIKAIDAPQIGVVNLPLPWRAAIMQEYPEVVYKKEGLGHEYFILGKTSETPKDDPRVSGLGSLTIAMDSSINSRHYIMEVRSDNPGLPLGGSFYFEIIRDDKILEEHIIPFNRYWTDNNQKIQSYASLRLSDIFKKKTWMDGSVVKITCRDPNQYLLDNYWFEVSVKPSNPLMYGMFERLD